MMSIAARKSLVLLSLLLLGSSQALPAAKEEVREQRNMQMATMSAEPKIMEASTANMTPTTMPVLGGGMPLNQLALGAVSNMQMARYPNYPGMMSPFGGMPGLQTTIASAYPADHNLGMGLGMGMGLGQAAPGLGLGLGLGGLGAGYGAGLGLGAGLGGFPGAAPTAGLMYSQPLYGNGQPGMAGFGPQPTLDSFVGMGNAPGLGLPIGPGYFGGIGGGLAVQY